MPHIVADHKVVNFRPDYKDGDHCKLFGKHTYRRFFIGKDKFNPGQKDWQNICTGCWKTQEEIEAK